MPTPSPRGGPPAADHLLEKITGGIQGDTLTWSTRRPFSRSIPFAVRDLRACYPDGIVAGRLRSNAYWARDGFWTLFGALALGEYDQARAHLNTFIRYQLPSGALPVRIEFIGYTFGGYHTRRVHPKVLYRAAAIFVDPLDPTALFVIAAREYFEHTQDTSFCSGFNPVMDRAVRWLMQQDRDRDGILENRRGRELDRSRALNEDLGPAEPISPKKAAG